MINVPDPHAPTIPTPPSTIKPLEILCESELSTLPDITQEARKKGIDIILLQETKMTKEEEPDFEDFSVIHSFFNVVVDNLNEQERRDKRDKNLESSSSNQNYTSKQDNVAGSEGLLTAVRLKNGLPIYNFITIDITPTEKLLVHNVYAPCDKLSNKKFLSQLHLHHKQVKHKFSNHKIHTVFAGDFNAILNLSDLEGESFFDPPSENNDHFLAFTQKNELKSAIHSLIKNNYFRFTHWTNNRSDDPNAPPSYIRMTLNPSGKFQ